MKERTWQLVSIGVLVGVLLAAGLMPAAAAGLSAAELSALNEAINEEYLAFNTYSAVLKQYPGALPFANIVNSEQQHISAIAGLFTKYGYKVPANPGFTAPTWATRQAACQTGVQVEIEDIALYDRLLTVSRKMDFNRVFTHLRAASQNNHLPAFQACD